MIAVIDFKISFSQTFEKKGSRLMGLYRVGSLDGLFDFGIRMIIENFHCTGK